MIDKIIEELEELKQKNIIPIGGRANGKSVKFGFCNGVHQAIEVVRKYQNLTLSKQIALLPNDLNGETIDVIREKGNE